MSILLILAAQGAGAAIPPPPPAPTEATSAPDAIIVTAAELPPPLANAAYGAQRIDAAALAAVPSGRVEAALALVPGFQQFRRADSRSANPSAQGVTLRAIGGNASSRTLLLLDGVPQADPFFGFIPFSAVPMARLGAVQVTRGSGVGPFGSGALAGVVDLRTADPADAPLLDLAASYGSRDATDLSLSATVPLGAGHLMIDARRDAGDGFYTTPADQRGGATVPARYRGQMVALGAEVPAGDATRVTARVTAFEDDRTLRFAGADSGANGVDASLRLVHQGRWAVEALGWVQMRDFTNIVVSAATFRPTLNQRGTPSTGWGGKLEVRAPGPDTRLIRFGADVRGAEGRVVEDSLNFAGTVTQMRRAGGEQFIAGLFAESDWRLGRWLLTAGARADHWRQSGGFLSEVRGDGTLIQSLGYAPRSDTLFTARGGIGWQASEAVTLRASAYRGFRLPTLNELYRPFVVFPVTTRANAALDPERLDGAEAGVDVRTGPVTLGLTGFAVRVRDAIGNVTIGTNLRQRQNIPAIRSRGVEGTAALALGAFRLDAALAYVDAEVDAGVGVTGDGLRPAQSPRFSGALQLAWSGARADASLLLRHVGLQFEDDRNLDALPAATTLDAAVGYRLGGGWRLFASAENLFDERVITRNAGGTQDLGAPRTLRAGLRWTFD